MRGVVINTDWSRETRKKLTLLTPDHEQTTITSYFSVLNEIKQLLKKNSKLTELLSTQIAIQDNTKVNIDMPSLLGKLIENAEANCPKYHKSRRYTEVITKFATSLFIYSGPLAYNFIQQNMPTAIPHLRTVQRSVNKEYLFIKDGEYRFKGLLHHLNKHKCTKIVSIGEDATRVISRVDYDSSSDQLVGFVLPMDSSGLPKLDSFPASSFETIENHFLVGTVAKYAFVYMAQPLSKTVPSYVLACLSSDNKFTAEHVIQRWKYIHFECAKLGIDVISFGADGDSREMKTMRVSSQLQYRPDPLWQLSPSSSLSKLKLPNEWIEWFALKYVTNICYVQDMVHIGVKMKSRLLKPSIVLPMGKYIAGLHSLSTIKTSFHKGEHGLHEKDLNQKDKQNYSSVIRITSSSVLEILKKVPDGLGTYYYLDVLRCVLDSYLDKQLSPLKRVEKIWYGLFFLRYWREYIRLSQHYSLENNFLSLNAYTCVELNAHSLIAFLIILRNSNQSTAFMPWLLGSQSCEKVFRTARSMTSTFSTVINFSILGLLRRLHRMEIQLKLESEDKNGIIYPRVEEHRKKDGHSKQWEYNLTQITDKQINEAVEKGKTKAKTAIEELGMSDVLIKADCFNNPPKLEITATKKHMEKEEEKDNEEDDETLLTEIVNIDIDSELYDDQEQILHDIKRLEKNVIDENLSQKLHQRVVKLQKENSSSLPIYKTSNQHNSTEEVSYFQTPHGKSKHTPFVSVQHNGNECFIRKSTAVWLLSEGERVSSDRLLRVRTNQPFNGKFNEIPHDSIKIGDVCAFAADNTYSIGRVLQFAFYKESLKKAREYKGKTVNLSASNKAEIGVLCSWYTVKYNSPMTFTLNANNDETKPMAHLYQPVSSYLCKLSNESFEAAGLEEEITPGFLTKVNDDNKIILAKTITVSDRSLLQIENLLKSRSMKREELGKASADKKQLSNVWVSFENLQLTHEDKRIVTNDQWLNDKHMSLAQNLIKNQFPKVNGFNVYTPTAK